MAKIKISGATLKVAAQAHGYSLLSPKVSVIDLAKGATSATLATAANFANGAAGVVVGKLGTATVTPEELLAYTHG